MASKFDITKHYLVPKQAKLSEKEKEKLLEDYKITTISLPKINIKDASIANLKAKEGDIIKITRQNPYVGETIFYRCVINA
jgi:DNA-directed RNA polymerase subunit H